MPRLLLDKLWSFPLAYFNYDEGLRSKISESGSGPSAARQSMREFGIGKEEGGVLRLLEEQFASLCHSTSQVYCFPILHCGFSERRLSDNLNYGVSWGESVAQFYGHASKYPRIRLSL